MKSRSFTICSLSFAQTATPVALMKAAVSRSSGYDPLCFSLSRPGLTLMSESAMACPPSQNDHLVLSTEEVVCIPPVVRVLLEPSSLLPLFHYGLFHLKNGCVVFAAASSHPSPVCHLPRYVVYSSRMQSIG